MKVKETKQSKKQGRDARVRAKISGTAKRPRLCVFRSNKHIYVQLIDDDKGKTLVAVSDKGIKAKGIIRIMVIIISAWPKTLLNTERSIFIRF